MIVGKKILRRKNKMVLFHVSVGFNPIQKLPAYKF